MAVIRRVQHRKSLSVVAVRVGTQLMLHIVNLEILGFSHLDHPVFCHGSFPHDVASRFVILRILKGFAEIPNNALHQGFGNIIGHVVLNRETEIGFHDMRQDIESACPQLPQRHGIGVGRIHQGEIRIHPRIVPVGLDVFFRIGQHCGTVHLTAGGRHGYDHAQRQWIEIQIARLFPELFPHVAVVRNGDGNGFAAVHYTAAAHGQNPGNPLFLCQTGALLHFLQGRVGHDAAEFHDFHAGILQDSGDFIVYAVLLNGAAAVSQQHLAAIASGQHRQLLCHHTFSEIYLRPILKLKIIHRSSLC